MQTLQTIAVSLVLHTVSLQLYQLFRIGASRSRARQNLVLGAIGIGHVVGQMDLEASGLTDQTALEHGLVEASTVAHKPVILQQQTVEPRGNHHPAAIHGCVGLAA